KRICNRKICGKRDSGYVRAARGINSNGVRLFNCAAADVGRVGKHRVYDERLPSVIVRQFKADFTVGADSVAAVDGGSSTGFPLIDDGLVLPSLAVQGVDHQDAACVNGNSLGPVNLKPDRAGIASGSHNEVVLQFALSAVVDDIDAWINLFVAYTC